jgi:hypothetical protein
MRADEFIREEDKLNEVLPLVGIAAKAAGGMLGKRLGGAAAGTVGKAIGKKMGKAIGSAIAAPNNQTMGAPDTQPQGNTPADPARDQALDKAKDQIIKPGATVNLPTDGTGGPEEFKIAGIQGDEVEIENPAPAPGEPNKTVYKKDDIKKSMSL